MAHAWRMRIKLAGNLPVKEVLTGDLRFQNPGWGDEIFKSAIASMEFFLPTGHKIVMCGMDSYNFFVEATQDMSRSGAKIQAFWFLGRIPDSNIVEMWRVGDGQVTRQRKIFGQEWGGTATRGWKLGVPGNAISAIMEA